ncbi:ATP-dependent Clp protease ATP-binding subunit ClpX [bacterium]|nr:ATP-dependent Clp protease ATP-binding subunit ClpX [bacterium]
MEKENKPVCQFCGRTADEAGGLIRGNLGGLICSDCIYAIHNLLQDKQREKPKLPFDEKTLPKPKEIKGFLDKYVIGQENAKIVVSVSVYNHYKRVLHFLNQKPGDVELEKSNILMIGPTGVGKTLIAQTLARFLNVPFAIADATTLTEAGYVGEDVENILVRLLQTANYNVPLAELGIIYIDELDKIGRKSENPSITKDVSGEGVQQALLKLLENTDALVPPEGGRKHPEQPLIKINTSNILFIAGGHFDGLDKIVAHRTNEILIGFDGKSRKEIDTTNILNGIEPEDLIHYGLIPELVGRLPVSVILPPLDKSALRSILLEPRNALIKQYRVLFEMENVELEIEDSAIDSIVNEAVKKKTGARALKSIVERIFIPITYELPSRENVKKLVITSNTVKKGADPKWITYT